MEPLDLTRTGRRRCTTVRTDSLNQRSVETHDKITVPEVMTAIQSYLNVVSIRTIRNRIKESKFIGGFANKRPMISEKNSLKRLTFARKYLSMPMEFWS